MSDEKELEAELAQLVAEEKKAGAAAVLQVSTPQPKLPEVATEVPVPTTMAKPQLNAEKERVVFSFASLFF